ncbi:MAG: cytochrome C oxidase subunit IV family protein [Nitrospirae bacterium]|nr:cytochrome C oxidase subunit IV family protein [Nitrospirota bacterium]
MNKNNDHTIGFKTYIAIWFCLVVLTAITVTVSGLNMGRYGALASVLIASVKAALVLLFFMHLKYERPFLKLMLLVTICTIAVIIGLTFFDIGVRY